LTPLAQRFARPRYATFAGPFNGGQQRYQRDGNPCPLLSPPAQPRCFASKDARGRGHPVTLGLCLIYACTVSIWCGDLVQADEHIDRLVSHAARHSLRPYEALGSGLTAVLEIARGELGAGVGRLRNALASLQAEQHHILRTTFSVALAEGLALAGETEEALATIDAALEWAEQEGGTYGLPDLLRAKSQVLLSFPEPDTRTAERILLRSLTAAHQQSALSWELRAAIALTRLWIEPNPDAAREVLAGVHRQFTEGFATADLKTAEQLLGKLG
jgi:predicted ATPase